MKACALYNFHTAMITLILFNDLLAMQEIHLKER
jgi:hypothetical protein